MPSVYLSASTQEKNMGADGIPEETRMQVLAQDIAAKLNTVGLIAYLNRPDYSLAQIIYDSNAKKPDLHVALHSNAGGGSGTETWTYKLVGTKSFFFGQQLQKTVAGVLGLPDRGCKDGVAAGLAEITQTKATSVLCEFFFHDNAGDIKVFNAKRQELINAIADLICKWFGVNNNGEQQRIRELETALAKEREKNRTLLALLKDIAFKTREYSL